MPPKTSLVFTHVSRDLRNTPFYEGYKLAVSKGLRAVLIEVSSLSEESIQSMAETSSENLRRGELAALLGLRLGAGRGNWSQVRHFTTARNSGRLADYLVGQMRVARIPKTPSRYNVGYHPADIEKDQEAQSYVKVAVGTRGVVAPALVIPWFGDNPKQSRAMRQDKKVQKTYGHLIGQGVVNFLARCS